MEDCLEAIKQWMTSNCLCMNDNKTEYLPVVPETAAALVVDSVIRVGDATITLSRSVRNLGVIIDRNLDFKKQVSSIVSVCAFNLRHINQMSRYLPIKTMERIVNAIITSRLDYCCSLLYSTTVINIARLQRMHNSAARLTIRRSRSDSAMSLLCIVHWLSVAARLILRHLRSDSAMSLLCILHWLSVAARLILRHLRSDSAMSLLCILHWLSVVARLILRHLRSDSAVSLLCILHWLSVAARLILRHLRSDSAVSLLCIVHWLSVAARLILRHLRNDSAMSML